LTINIAIDGKNLTGDISGIARYLAETILILSKFDTKISLIVPKEPNAIYDVPSNVEIVQDKQKRHSSSLIWHLSRVSDLMRNVSCDLFWGPAHRLPFGLNPKIKMVVTCHDLVCFNHGNTMPLKNFISDRIQLPIAMKRAHKIHAVSQNTLSEICKTFPKLEQKVFSTLPQKQNTSDFIASKVSTPNKWGTYGLFVGTFEPRKNIYQLIEAYNLMCEASGEDPGLVIAGKFGWGGINPKAKISSLATKRNIEVVYAPSDNELKLLYQNCRFLINPSIYEGLGLPVIEAKRFNKPCIVSPGSLIEIADEHSIVINPHDNLDIANAMAKYFFDKRTYDKALREACLSPARFTWHKNTKILMEQFYSLTRQTT